MTILLGWYVSSGHRVHRCYCACVTVCVFVTVFCSLGVALIREPLHLKAFLKVSSLLCDW